jgi:hypothetical protein
VKNELMLPVLAIVPLIESDDEQKHRVRCRFVVTGAIAALVGLCVPVVIYSSLH